MAFDPTATSSIPIGSSAKGEDFTQTKQLSMLPAHSRTSTNEQKENVDSTLVQLDPCSHTHFWPGQLQPQWGIFNLQDCSGLHSSTAALLNPCMCGQSCCSRGSKIAFL